MLRKHPAILSFVVGFLSTSIPLNCHLHGVAFAAVMVTILIAYCLGMARVVLGHAA